MRIDVGATLDGGRYRLQRRLGAGGMATVWLAQDERLGRPVAIKIIADTMAGDDGWMQRFGREARAAAALSHPGVVPVYDYGVEDGRPYLVMEYVTGGTLAERLAEGQRIPEPRRVARELLEALAAIHAAGILHRDIKPANLLLDSGDHVRVTDFGIAQAQDATSLTRTGMVVGTLRYLAPEIAAGEAATARSDLFSAGKVIEELAGHSPSPELGPLVRQLTALEPSDRPPSALDALQLIGDATTQTRALPSRGTAETRAIPAGTTGQTRAMRAPAPDRRQARPRPAAPPMRETSGVPRGLAVAALALLAVVLLIVAIGVISSSSGSSTPSPASESAPISQQVSALQNIVSKATKH